MPEINAAFAMLTNSEKGSSVNWAVSKWVGENIHNLPEPKQAESRDPVEAIQPDENEFIGVYQRPYTRVEIGKIGERLIGIIKNLGGFPSEDVPPAESPPPMTLEIKPDGRLLVCDGPQKGSVWGVVRKDDGTIGWLRIGARIHPKQV
jgi:hypothetical protein